MQQLAIYTRDEGGIVEGPRYQQWESKQQALEYYIRDDEPLETEHVMGWPHKAIEWHGSIGFGV